MPSEITAQPSELLWLSTRDGSPTLWNNTLSESYRSLRGAFTESYWAFVRPALEAAKNRETTTSPLSLGEFGLGLGTNWLLWTQLASNSGISFRYCAIERDLKTFSMGLEKWKLEFDFFERFALKQGFSVSKKIYFDGLADPRIETVASPDALQSTSNKFDLWFHDPFGAEVNPEGYTLETLRKLESSWSRGIRGFSYACNRVFQDSLRSLDIEVDVVDFEEPIGKRSRLEFKRKA